MNTHPAEEGHQVLQETAQATAHQRMHKPGGKSVPDIQDAKEWGQERHSDPLAYGETPLPGASLGGHFHKTEFVPRIIIRQTSEHSEDRKPKDNYNIPNDNQITEVTGSIPAM